MRDDITRAEWCAVADVVGRSVRGGKRKVKPSRASTVATQRRTKEQCSGKARFYRGILADIAIAGGLDK